MEPDEKFLRYILENLVEQPEKIEVERKTDELGILLSVRCAQEDMGKIIGRQGATAKAIRTVLRTVGQRHNQRVNMKIEEPENASSDFNRSRMREAFVGIA